MMALLPWLAAAVGVALVVGLYGWRARGAGARERARTARIEALTAAGELGAAARLALDGGRLDVAFELFVQNKELAQAATVAVRRGDLRRAANLHEQIGNWEQAIALYDRVGLHRHADTLRQTRLNLPPAAILAGLPEPPVAGAREVSRPSMPPVTEQLPAVTPEAPAAIASTAPRLDESAPLVLPPPPPVLPPIEAPPVTASPSPPSSAIEAPSVIAPPSRAAADARLAEGDIAGAAELFATIGLDDEATHLWVDVLGDPARAARLYASRGKHERAAELHELAGDRQHAALAWIDAARASARPESLLERIVELSPVIALRFLEEELVARPLSAATAEWHYQKARAVDRAGDARRALTLYLELQDAVGGHRDVEERVRELTRALQPAAVASRIRRNTREPIELPPDARPSPAPVPELELPAPEAEAAAPVPELELPAVETFAAAAPATIADVDHQQLQALAAQVADAALDKARRRSRLSTLPGPVAIPPPAEPRADGLERSPLDPALLDDRAVEAARRGPPLGALEYMAGGRPCDRTNVEIYYRIGLAHHAAGNFEDALGAFAAVEQVWPGYRDAKKRIEDLRRWMQTLASTSLAATRTSASPVADATARPTPGAGARAAGPTIDVGDRYELRGELGRGRGAVVYRAHDRVLDRDVALELLADRLSSQPAVRERYLRQAEAVAELGHPNLVAVHDTGVIAGRAFVAMELVDGHTLATLRREPGGLSIVEALRLMKQVLDALAHLHAHSFVHGDVRPATIMRTASGLVKLMHPGVTAPAGDVARAAYAAPELLAGADVDQRADVFAAAVTLFELLAKQLPYPDLARQAPPPRLSSLVQAVPAQLEAAIMRALALDPEQRTRSAAELGGRIGGILVALDAYVASRRRPPASPPT